MGRVETPEIISSEVGETYEAETTDTEITVTNGRLSDMRPVHEQIRDLVDAGHKIPGRVPSPAALQQIKDGGGSIPSSNFHATMEGGVPANPEPPLVDN